MENDSVDTELPKCKRQRYSSTDALELSSCKRQKHSSRSTGSTESSCFRAATSTDAGKKETKGSYSTSVRRLVDDYLDGTTVLANMVMTYLDTVWVVLHVIKQTEREQEEEKLATTANSSASVSPRYVDVLRVAEDSQTGFIKSRVQIQAWYHKETLWRIGEFVIVDRGQRLARWTTSHKTELQLHNWASGCWEDVAPALKAFLHDRMVKNKHFDPSTAPTAQWLLMTYGVSEYFYDAEFELHHFQTGELLKLDLVCQVSPEQEGKTLSYRNILLTGESQSDTRWATSSLSSGAETHEYFWYAIRDLETGRNMHVTRQNIRNAVDRKVYELPDTRSKDSYGDCRIYSNEHDVYFAVTQPYYWEHDKKTPIPKIFRYCWKSDQMLSVAVPSAPELTLDDFKGKFSEESLNDNNEYARECEGADCDLTMEEFERQECHLIQNAKKEWRWINGTVMPDTGDFLVDVREFTRSVWRPKLQEVHYYCLATQQWTLVDNWPEDYNTRGPLAMSLDLLMSSAAET